MKNVRYLRRRQLCDFLKFKIKNYYIKNIIIEQNKSEKIPRMQNDAI